MGMGARSIVLLGGRIEIFWGWEHSFIGDELKSLGGGGGGFNYPSPGICIPAISTSELYSFNKYIGELTLGRKSERG